MSVKQRKEKHSPVAILSFAGKGDAYSQSLFKALREAGTDITEGVFSRRWLEANHRHFDCVHLNWPSFLYADSDVGRLRTLINFARFIVLIQMLRLWGLPVYWTAHNLYPHEPCVIPGLDWLSRRFVIAISHRIFVHGPCAAGILAEEFPSARRKMVVIDHGNWVNFYPRGCNRGEARKRLGLDADEFVFLFIGLCREYKNLHGLLQAFEKIEETSTLMIAGAFLSEAYYHKIRDMAERLPRGRVILRPGFIPDEEMQYFLTAADAVVLPYTEVLTSGAAVLALSFGRPVVAPRRGYLVDLVSYDCGILYATEDSENLLSAMRKAMKQQFDEKRIIHRALELDWRETAKRIIDVVVGG